MKLIKLLEVIGAFLAKWLADEAKAWIIWAIRQFFDRTVRDTPEPMRSEYGEAWLNHIESLPGTVFVSARLLAAALSIRSRQFWAQTVSGFEHLKVYLLVWAGLIAFWGSFKFNGLSRGSRRSLVSDSEGTKLLVCVLLLVIIASVLNSSSKKNQSETRPV